MVNSRGFIRIVEMVIAIVIILTIILITYRRDAPLQKTPDLSETARDILRDISSQEVLRSEVLAAQTNTTLMSQAIAFVNFSLPDYLSFELRACETSIACGQSVYHGDVYSAERIISADTITFNTIKLRLFIWTKP